MTNDQFQMSNESFNDLIIPNANKIIKGFRIWNWEFIWIWLFGFWDFPER